MTLDPLTCRQAVLARDARYDGRFFTAVLTTGIYCRPVCPARPPKVENCRYYVSAAAAQAAGFRPCLRCRPETAPGVGAWLGAANTVSRGLAMIEAGALDAGDVNRLGERLGVGERHLRRLFLAHLGANPVAVAQARRINIAKQLIHETRLPMAEIAFASGFRSVRRFNETFQGLFGRPPSELRRTGPRPAGEALTLSLSYRPPFDWDGLLEFLVHRAIPGVEQIVGGVYRRTIGLDGVAGDLAVSHEPERRRLRVAVNFPRAADLPRIISRVKAMFDLDADPLTIAEALGRDPDMRAKIAARPGLRVPGCWDPFELAVRAILGQQISVAAATRLAGGIARRWGDAYAGEGLDRLFPTAAQLATAEIDGMPGSRARSISSLAAAVAADGAVLAPAADLASAIAHLKRLPGVGDWTAHYIAMRALREPDAFPAADLGLMKAMDLGAGRPDAKSLEAASQAWRPWRAYAALHLWTSPHIKEIPHAVAA